MNRIQPDETISLIPDGSPTATIPPRYSLGVSPGSYAGKWTGQPVRHPLPEDNEDEWVRAQTGYCQPHPGPSVGNYLVRRDPMALISGDLPRFALLDYRREASHKLTPYLLGDVRVMIKIGGKNIWLDEHGAVETDYFPWGTQHRVEIGPLTVLATASLIENVGLALTLAVDHHSDEPVEVLLCCGGLGMADMRGGDRPECLLLHSELEANDHIVIADGAALFTDEAIPYAVRVQADAKEVVLMADTDDVLKRAAFRWILSAGPAQLNLVVSKQVSPSTPLNPAYAGQYISATKQYYADLLVGLEIRTPDPLLDAAFYSAVAGLDYTYAAPGWFEGLTDWPSYFSNNYQLSAAVALRQDARAKAALRFFALHPGGPGQVYHADGSADESGKSYAQNDGLFYAILQLYHYWKATGDRATLAEVWSAFCGTLEQYVSLRDSDGDGLLDFHPGCNVFLYQADHLSLPGAGFSPSVMFAAMLPRMAEMAQSLGEQGLADGWRLHADRLHWMLSDQFWFAEEGRFVSGIDPQGRRQVASYYTDYAFPALYSSLPVEKRYQSLLAMDQTLSLGPCLLRTGNYRPDLFGNNGVHQVGMCEAAEGQCREGRAQRGWELLHGTAAGATVISFCPGTFYEFASWEGQGLLNKHFGNPIGCYVQAVVTGLFGFIRTTAPAAQSWQPAIPESWPRAYLRLGGTELEITGQAAARTYRIRPDSPQAANLRLPLFGRRAVRSVDAAGEELAFITEAHPAGGFIHVELAASTEHVVTLTLSSPATLSETFAPSPKSKIAPLPVAATARYRTVAMDLSPYFNGDRIRPVNFWGYLAWIPGAELTYDLRPYVEKASATTGELVAGDFSFTVIPAGRNLAVLSLGDLDSKTNRLGAATVPAQFTFPVGRTIAGLEFLTVAEPRVRLTGMEGGRVECRYADGFVESFPLIVGEQLDSTLSPYATRTTVFRLAKGRSGLSSHLAAWRIPVDATRITETVTVRVTSFDIMLAVLAINLNFAFKVAKFT